MGRNVGIHAAERLCLTLWVGGGLFLALVLAPSAFHLLPDRHAAGLLVGSCLRSLHWIGLGCGAVLAILFLASRRSQTNARASILQLGLVTAMLGLTASSQFGILPRMERLRQAGSTAGEAFDSLHRWSVWLESAVLLLGIALTVQMERMEHGPDGPR